MGDQVEEKPGVLAQGRSFREENRGHRVRKASCQGEGPGCILEA